MKRTPRSWRGTSVCAVLLLGFAWSCKNKQEEPGTSNAQSALLDFSDLPSSVFDFDPPFGILPGIVLGVTTDSYGRYDRRALDSFKDCIKSLFIERARRHESLFFTVVAINARAVNGFAGFFKARKIKGEAAREMERGYDELPPDLRAVFSSEREDLEKLVLLVNDEAGTYFERFNLPDLGGVVIGKDQKTSAPGIIPESNALLHQQLLNLLPGR